MGMFGDQKVKCIIYACSFHTAYFIDGRILVLCTDVREI